MRAASLPTSMSDHSVRKTVSTYFAAVSMLDATALAETFSERGESEDPLGAPVCRGRAAIRDGFAALAARLSELAMEPSRVFICGSGAAVLWNAQGLGKNGRQVMFAGISVFALDSQARIERLQSFWDPAPVLRELALAPPAQPR